MNNFKSIFGILSGHILQSQTNFMKRCPEIQSNWTGREDFNICFCVIFDH